jgi:hypothetical protein
MLAIITGLLVLALAQGRDPWFDESALITNLLSENARSLLAPMRYFEQATPLAHRILGVVIAQFFDAQDGIYAAVMALRALSAAAALLMAFFVFKTVRLFGRPIEAMTAAIMVAGSVFAVRYATEVKHYAFEAAATAAALYAAALVSKSPGRRKNLWILLATALVGYAFSFTLLLVVAACSIGLVLTIFLRGWSPGATLRSRFSVSGIALFAWSYRWVILVCLTISVAGVCFYVGYTLPATALQFAASPDRYQADGKVGLDPVSVARASLNLVRFLYAVLAPVQGPRVFAGGLSGHLLTYTFAFSLLAACLLAFKRGPFVPVSAAALFVTMIIINLAGGFPFVWERHFYFMAPLFAAMLVLGAGEALGRLRSRAELPAATAPLGFALLATFYVAGGLSALRSLKVEEVSPLLRHIEAVSPNTPVWVYYGAQPAVSLLAPHSLLQLGLLDHRSSSEGWVVRTGARDPRNIRVTSSAYIRLARDVISAQNDVWLLFAHEKGADHEVIVSAVESRAHRCALQVRAPGADLYRCRATQTSAAGSAGPGSKPRDVRQKELFRPG